MRGAVCETQREGVPLRGVRIRVLLQPLGGDGGGDSERTERTAGVREGQGAGQGDAGPAGRVLRHARERRAGRGTRGAGGDGHEGDGDEVSVLAAQHVPVQRIRGAHDRCVLPVQRAEGGYARTTR